MTTIRKAFAGWESRTNTELEIDTTNGTGAPTIGTLGVNANSGAAYLTCNTAGVGKAISLSDFRVGFYTYHTTISNNAVEGMSMLLYTTGTCKIELGIYNVTGLASPELRLYINNVLVSNVDWVSVGLNTPSVWKHIGVNVVTGSTGYVTLYLDKTQILTYSGNIPGVVSGIWSTGRKGTAAALTSWRMDDWFLDERVGEADVALPRLQWSAKRYITAGTYAQFSSLSGAPNEQNIDDPLTAVHDGDTTFNYTLGPNKMDSFLPEPYTSVAGNPVRAVTPYSFARKAGPEDCKLNFGIRSSIGTEVLGTANPLLITYSPVWSRFEVDADGNPWADTVINATEGIYKSEGTFV